MTTMATATAATARDGVFAQAFYCCYSYFTRIFRSCVVTFFFGNEASRRARARRQPASQCTAIHFVCGVSVCVRSLTYHRHIDSLSARPNAECNLCPVSFFLSSPLLFTIHLQSAASTNATGRYSQSVPCAADSTRMP